MQMWADYKPWYTYIKDQVLFGCADKVTAMFGGKVPEI